jgi:hypothetical protein
VDWVERVVATVESDPMPVPIREIWVFGDVVLGLDPIARLDIYVTKDLLFKDRPEAEAEFEAEHGIQGVGKTVSADWAEQFPQHVRANSNGHAAPEQCLGAHLLPDDEPIHLEVCNTGFEDNITQRLRGAQARTDWTQLLDPRAACLWVDSADHQSTDRRQSNDAESRGFRSTEAFRKLRESEFVFPTLNKSLSMLGLDDDEADEATEVMRRSRAASRGSSVRGDVV